MVIDIGQRAVLASPIVVQLGRQEQLLEEVVVKAQELEERLLVISKAIEAPDSIKEEETVLSVTGQKIEKANRVLYLLCEMINSMIVRLEI